MYIPPLFLHTPIYVYALCVSSDAGGMERTLTTTEVVKAEDVEFDIGIVTRMSISLLSFVFHIMRSYLYTLSPVKRRNVEKGTQWQANRATEMDTAKL